MSQFIALLTFLCFALSLLLAVRFKSFAKIAKGLSRQIRIHHYLGCILAVLIAAHVLIELWNLPAAIRFSSIQLEDQGFLTGWLALALFSLAFVTGFWPNLSFGIWRRFHLLFVASFLLAIVHVLYFRFDDPLIMYFTNATMGLGLLSLLLLVISHCFPPAQKIFKISSLRLLHKQLMELILEPIGLPEFKEEFPAGQIVYLRFLQSEFSHSWHPFSIASCQGEPYLRLIVKKLGRDTNRLDELRPGDQVAISGPFIELPIVANRDQVWVSGGVGIAPFIGFVHCLDTISWQQVQLFHFANEMDSSAIEEELRKIAVDSTQISWQTIKVAPQQKPDLSPVIQGIAKLKQPLFLICGPPPFMKFVRKTLRRQGIARCDIITEEFSPW